jgi:steroid delta-isomerase-like uncharacterized protein
VSAGRELDASPIAVLAERWQDAWSSAAGDGFAACCTPDVQYEDPIATDPLRGIEALSGHAQRLRDAFPDLRVQPAGAPLGGDAFACFPWRVLATHSGDLATVPATNRFITLHGVHYAELRDGQIRRARGFFDLYDAAVQLGLLPTRGSLSETALLLLRGFGLRSTGP